MLIDWFTVGAQFINFLILVLIMKRLLYRPILEAIGAREKRVADALNEAAQKKTEAAKELALLHQTREQLENQKSTLLKQATEDVEEKRKELIATARQEVSLLETQWRDALGKDKDLLRQELTARVEKEVLAITRKVLQDLACAELDEFIVREFIQQLRSFAGNGKNKISRSFKFSYEPIVIRSVFKIHEQEKQTIENVVREQLWPTAKIRFDTAPELISGIEMIAAGHRISWNVATYLSSLEKSLQVLLTTASKSNAGNGQ